MNNKAKTIICVTLAGFSFVPALLFDLRYLFVLGAFFDWLPLPMGWMKFKEGNPLNKNGLILHVVITLVAYTFGVIWLFTGFKILSLFFLEIWWMAVMIGNFIYKET